MLTRRCFPFYWECYNDCSFPQSDHLCPSYFCRNPPSRIVSKHRHFSVILPIKHVSISNIRAWSATQKKKQAIQKLYKKAYERCYLKKMNSKSVITDSSRILFANRGRNLTKSVLIGVKRSLPKPFIL